MKSASILKMSGAFVKNPQRAREDLAGVGEFDPNPPEHLPPEVVPAWHYVVARVPKCGLSKSEEVAVEVAAHLYADFRAARERRERKAIAESLMIALGHLGMTRPARAKLGTSGKAQKASKFQALKDSA